MHGRDGREDRYSWVDIDNFGIFYDLTRLMVMNGHRHIVFINGDERFTFASERRRGVETALRDLDLPPATVRIINALHPMGDAGFQLTNIALEDAAVTAIIYSSSLMAVEGQSALGRAGRRVGQTIEIASMDDELHYLDLGPYRDQITFASSPLSLAGRTLAGELIRQCEGDAAPRGQLIPHTYHFATSIDGSKLG